MNGARYRMAGLASLILAFAIAFTTVPSAAAQSSTQTAMSAYEQVEGMSDAPAITSSTTNKLNVINVSGLGSEQVVFRTSKVIVTCALGTCTVYFSRAATERAYQRRSSTDKTQELASLLCGLTIHPVAIVVCGLLTRLQRFNFQTAISDAHNKHQCIAGRYVRAAAGGPSWWIARGGKYCIQDITRIIRPIPRKPKPGCTFRSASWLKLGAKGRDVEALQRRLNAQGAKLRVDGDFGPKTRAAVVAFQRSHHLSPDGIVGPKTQAALSKVCPKR